MYREIRIETMRRSSLKIFSAFITNNAILITVLDVYRLGHDPIKSYFHLPVPILPLPAWAPLPQHPLHRPSRLEGDGGPDRLLLAQWPGDGPGLPAGVFGLVGQPVPIEAGMAIVIYNGVVMAAQVFEATPPPWFLAYCRDRPAGVLCC